ncbi:MAG TPA: hypothetical protein VF885_07455 [Arthrobacter sp.]
MTAIHSATPAPIEALVMTAASLPSSDVTAQAFVRGIAVRAFSLGLSDNELLRFLKKHTAQRPGLSSLLSDRFAYRRLIASCRRAALSSSPAGAAENAVKTGRLTLGRILTPVPVDDAGAPVLTPAKQIRARAALAVLCVEQMKSIQGEKGWNTIMVSYPWLALRMGVSWPTAKAALNDLVDLEWIQEVGGARPDSARRFKISGHLTKDQAQFVKRVKDEQGQVTEPGQFEAIGALAGHDGDPGQADLLTAALTRSVTHPSWTYGTDPLGFKTWLLALSLAAGVDPVQLGIQSRSIPALNRLRIRAGLDLLIGADQGDTNPAESDLPARLSGALNNWSKSMGAFDGATAAKDAYKANAAARTDELARVRQLRADARPAMEKLFGPVESIPDADTSAERQGVWLAGASNAMAKAPMAEAQRKALAFELKRRLRVRGYKGDAITRIVTQVMASARPLLGAEDTIPLATEDATVKSAWLKSAVADLQGRTMRAGERDAFEAELRGRLGRRGYDKPVAQRLANLILQDVALAA